MHGCVRREQKSEGRVEGGYPEGGPPKFRGAIMSRKQGHISIRVTTLTEG